MTSYRTIYQTCSPCAYRRIKKSNDDSKHIPKSKIISFISDVKD